MDLCGITPTCGYHCADEHAHRRYRRFACHDCSTKCCSDAVCMCIPAMDSGQLRKAHRVISELQKLFDELALVQDFEV